VDRGEFYSYVWLYLKDGKRLSTFDSDRGEFDFWFAKVLENFSENINISKTEEPVEIPIDDSVTNEIPSDDPLPTM